MSKIKKKKVDKAYRELVELIAATGQAINEALDKGNKKDPNISFMNYNYMRLIDIRDKLEKKSRLGRYK